jgi:predicted RNase H-like HicB family nuclease
MATPMKKTKITFKVDVCVEKDGEGYYAYCPALEGVHVGGESKEEAIKNVRDAVSAYIKSLIKHGDPIPLDFIETQEEQPTKVICPSYQRYTQNVRVAV